MTALGAADFFPIPPDAGVPMRVARIWSTDILTADDGTETRISTFDQPVRRMEFSAALDSSDEAGLFRQLWYNATQPLRFQVPLWRERADPTAIAGAVVTCDTTNRRFVVGQQAALWQWDGKTITWEVRTVQSFNAASVTMTASITGTYIIGAVELYPLMTAWLDAPSTEERGYLDIVPLVFREELPGVAGIDATVLGEQSPPTPFTIKVMPVGEGVNPYSPKATVWRLIAVDADGVNICDPGAIWALSLTDARLVLTRALDGQSAKLQNNNYGGTVVNLKVTVLGVDSTPFPVA